MMYLCELKQKIFFHFKQSLTFLSPLFILIDAIDYLSINMAIDWIEF